MINLCRTSNNVKLLFHCYIFFSYFLLYLSCVYSLLSSDCSCRHHYSSFNCSAVALGNRRWRGVWWSIRSRRHIISEPAKIFGPVLYSKCVYSILFTAVLVRLHRRCVSEVQSTWSHEAVYLGHTQDNVLLQSFDSEIYGLIIFLQRLNSRVECTFWIAQVRRRGGSIIGG